MIKNTIMIASFVLTAVLTLSIAVKADFGIPALAQAITPKMHLDAGIAALQKGDTKGAMMHLNEADKGVSGAAKMHLDEAIAALQKGDTKGAMMHSDAAKSAMG